MTRWFKKIWFFRINNKAEIQTSVGDVTCYGDPIVKGVTHAQVLACADNKRDLDLEFADTGPMPAIKME